MIQFDMLCKERFVISSMLSKQLVEKYNTQNAKYNVEYVELVLDDESGIEVIGPRMLEMCQSRMPYTGMFVRQKGGQIVTLVQYIRLVRMHKDFCTVEVVWDDDPMYTAEYAEYRRS